MSTAALSFAISSNKSATFASASNSSWYFTFPFNAAVSCWVAATIVSSGETVCCVKYLCLENTVPGYLSASVDFSNRLNIL